MQSWQKGRKRGKSRKPNDLRTSPHFVTLLLPTHNHACDPGRLCWVHQMKWLKPIFWMNVRLCCTGSERSNLMAKIITIAGCTSLTSTSTAVLNYAQTLLARADQVHGVDVNTEAIAV